MTKQLTDTEMVTAVVQAMIDGGYLKNQKKCDSIKIIVNKDYLQIIGRNTHHEFGLGVVSKTTWRVSTSLPDLLCDPEAIQVYGDEKRCTHCGGTEDDNRLTPISHWECQDCGNRNGLENFSYIAQQAIKIAHSEDKSAMIKYLYDNLPKGGRDERT